MAKSRESILQFAPFESFVSPSFWHKLAELKLDQDRLSDCPRIISGHYSNCNAAGCLLELDYSAFNSKAYPPKYSHIAIGTIYNKNTIEEFKTLDKTALLTTEGKKLVDDMCSGDVLNDSSLLTRFFVLSFADLKSHSFYYWFAFPCPLTPTLTLLGNATKLKDVENFELFENVLRAAPIISQNFFVLNVNNQSKVVELLGLSSVLAPLDESAVDNYYYCFADPSQYEHPAWIMRNFVAFLLQKCPTLIGRPLKFLGLRYDKELTVYDSLIWHVKQNETFDFRQNTGSVKFVGWELNLKGKVGPRMVSMRDSMDPSRLAENSVNLNLKLMKWRLVPDLNLNIITQTKCLIFGAGTLGCAVARNLLSWGFKYITLVDNGKVGYSNPVRQNLFTHADAADGNKLKATAAANRLRDINPSAETKGIVLQIPMPGHTISDALRSQATDDVLVIEQMVQAHDVVFLLTDSRESRWLPTILGAAFGKIVINAALGFDSYLVMRHGSRRKLIGDNDKEIDGLRCISGRNLGCYFCSDVTAPGNSLKDRTLDQQCTVTRPGVSNIASSYAVEMLVSLLQHPKRDQAPAYYVTKNKQNADSNKAMVPEGLLGILPHSIRGMLYNFENVLLVTEKFDQCIGCSQQILDAYRSTGHAFLFKAFESSKFLEDLTGISELKQLKCSEAAIDFDELVLSDDSDE